MADAHFGSQPQAHSTPPNMDSTHSSSSKRRKIIGQCPTCYQSFASRSELRAHMADPQNHPPADESDAVSFGEMSDYDSLDENPFPQKPSSTYEPTLQNDGFEFSESNDQDGFDFLDADPDMFSNQSPDQGSVHTVHNEDEQPSVEHVPFEQSRKAQPSQKQALGVLYCGTCDKYFGNETVFKRHFMFGIKHGEEPRDMRDLYYKVWAKTWADDARNLQQSRFEEDVMEL